MAAFSPEFRFVAAACAAAAPIAPAAGLDWALVLRLALRHRVEGLVWETLRKSHSDCPEPLAEALRSNAQDIARASLRQAAESARLQGALNEAGVRTLVLKGSAVEMLAYGRLGLKRAWDIDLLVPPSEVDHAIRLLESLGYEIVEPAGLSALQFATWIELAKECELRNRQSGVVVELHWRLADGPSMLRGLAADSPTQRVSLGGFELETLAQSELFAYLCVHGAMHGWSRLKWLADLHAMLSQETPDGIEALWRRSQTLGAGRAPAQALLLCHDVFGLPLGPLLEARFRRDGMVRWLTRSALDIMAGGGPAEIHTRPFVTTRILAAQMALSGNLSGAWSELSYRWISLHDRVHLPLPRHLAFLYPLLRLPLWLGRRLGVGR